MDLQAAPPATIELGIDFEPAERVRRHLALGARVRRLALVVLLGALGLAAGAPPAPQPLTAAGILPANVYLGFQLGGAIVYTVTVGDAVKFAQRPTLDAYRLRDGRQLWRVPLPLRASLPQAVPVGDGVLLVTGTASAAPGSRTVAVDAATGVQLWSSPLTWLRSIPVGRTVLVGAYLDTDGAPGISPLVDVPSPRHPPPLQLTALDLRTGRTVWSVRVPAGDWTGLQRDSSAGSVDSRYAVIVSPDGFIRTIDLATGLTGDPVPFTLPVPPDLRVIGDWLLVAGGGRDAPVLSAFRLADLSLQWTIAVHSPHPATIPCGALVCVNEEQGSRAVELATGRTAWSTTRWTLAGMLGDWISATPLTDEAAIPGSRGSPVLLEPGTGAPVLNMSGWASVPGMVSPAGGPYVLRSVSATGPGTSVGVTWLALLHSAAGRPWIEPLAPVPEVFGNGCATADVYIVCETRENRLLAWQYEPAGRGVPFRVGT